MDVDKVLSTTVIVTDSNLCQIVQKHDENIKSNQRRLDDTAKRLDEVEESLCLKTDAVGSKIDRLNTKFWLLLVVLSAYVGKSLLGTFMSLGGM